MGRQVLATLIKGWIIMGSQVLAPWFKGFDRDEIWVRR